MDWGEWIADFPLDYSEETEKAISSTIEIIKLAFSMDGREGLEGSVLEVKLKIPVQVPGGSCSLVRANSIVRGIQ